MKKKYGVIHYSENWVYGPNIQRFNKREDAEKYIKVFRGGRHHMDDSAEIVEIVSRHESHVADQTDSEILYGLKEKK